MLQMYYLALSCGTRLVLFLSWESFFLSLCYSAYFTNAATPDPSTCLTVPLRVTTVSGI